MEWIKCSERIPEDSGIYLCYVEKQDRIGKSNYQWVCTWSGGGWWVHGGRYNGCLVTHWMPLPPPPTE